MSNFYPLKVRTYWIAVIVLAILTFSFSAFQRGDASSENKKPFPEFSEIEGSTKPESPWSLPATIRDQIEQPGLDSSRDLSGAPPQNSSDTGTPLNIYENSCDITLKIFTVGLTKVTQVEVGTKLDIENAWIRFLTNKNMQVKQINFQNQLGNVSFEVSDAGEKTISVEAYSDPSLVNAVLMCSR